MPLAGPSRLLCILVVVLFGTITRAATITAVDTAGFHSALSSAVIGDTIILNAGTTYTGQFTLPNKPAGSGYITIQSSQLASLPPAGTRIATSNAGNMPKIRAPGANVPALVTAPSAHHYKLIGIEIIGPTSGDLFQLISLGDAGSSQNQMSQVPNNIIMERCIVRANSSTQALRRGIGLNTAYTDIVDSRIEGCKWPDQDSQAIAGWNGPGPFNIINCYLEGACENVLFGGADASIANLVPSDIQLRRNHFFKPLSWKATPTPDPTFAGTVWSVKNLFELKNARRVNVEGNIFENHWIHAQSGPSILFTVRNQDGSNPWAVVEDVTFRNNIVRHASAGIATLGSDDNNPSGKAQRITIENNLFYDIGGTQWGDNGRLFSIMEGTDYVTINHNTGFTTYTVVVGGDNFPNQGFVFTNNLTEHSGYGVHGSGQGTGNTTLATWFPGALFTKNVLMGGPASLYSNHPGNYFPPSWSGVLNNFAGANFAAGDWNVVNGSVYDNGGTDSKDIGADIPTILTATAGCISGVWSGGPPPSSPTAASDSFAYTGSLNGQNGGTGFGSNAWAPISPYTSPAITSGSLGYSDGTRALVTSGNKLQPANGSRSSRNFPNAIATANTTLWVAFRANQTDTGTLPTNHAGFSLFSGPAATGTEIFLGKASNQTNWGMDHSGTIVQKAGAVTTSDRDALLVYKLVFTSSQVTISMWVDPVMVEGSLGTAHATLTKAHSTTISSVRFSVGTNSVNYQFDEFRMGPAFSDAVPTVAPIAYDGFNYTGGLNGQNGGTGFGSNAWAAISPYTSPTLAAGSLTYSDGTNSLVTTGNKLQPAAGSRSSRNFASTISTASSTKWVSFRINNTGTGTLPTNHCGFSLFSGPAATGTEIFLGKPSNATNWGMDHSTTIVQKAGSVTTSDRNAFLVYKLDFTSSQVTISMWVNPVLNEGSLGTAHATLTKAHSTTIESIRASTGTNASNYQLDEFRIGATFASVAPTP